MSHLSIHSYLSLLNPLQGILAIVLIHRNYSSLFCFAKFSLQFSDLISLLYQQGVDRVDLSLFLWNTFCWIFPTSLTLHFSSLHPPLFCLPSNVPGLCLFWTLLPNWSSPGMECHSASACVASSSSPLHLVYICFFSLLLPENKFHESMDFISVHPFIFNFWN